MIPLILLAACMDSGPNEGTIVGNPGDAALRLARTDGISFVEAIAYVSGLEMSSCTDSETAGERLSVEEEFDLTGDALFLELPAGDWCGIALDLDGPIEIYGEAGDEDRTDLEAFLDIGEVSAESSSAFGVDGNTFVFELGEPGWLERGLFGEESEECEELWELFEELEEDCEDGDEDACEELEDIEEEVRDCGVDEIDGEHPAHEELAASLASGSGLYSDPDGDGELSDGERDEGPVASGPERSDAQSTASGGGASADAGQEPPGDGGMDSESFPIGGGCGRSDANLSFLLLPLGLLPFRRRRES
jgi:hypothetical protein